MASDRGKLVRQLEAAGEAQVRYALQRGSYRTQEAFVRQWLQQQKDERLQRDQKEQLEIARSGADAAWVSAKAAAEAVQHARTANILATLALVVAVIAIAVSVFGYFLGR